MNSPFIKSIITPLYRTGIIDCFKEDETTFTLTFKDEQVKRCLTRAGQILEMKVFLASKNLSEIDGSPVYNDAVNGVVIDWDGKSEDRDTENEIDVMLMHGVVPVFISCKNGCVGTDELYKLNTVAERFGGKYAKKVLVATALDSLGKAEEYFIQRAEAMNIRIIKDIQNFTDEKLSSTLSNLWRC